MSFESSHDKDVPIGCNITALPPSRDGWSRFTTERLAVPLEIPVVDAPPEVPAPGDDKYHGGRIDLTETDLGKHLALYKDKLGPRVVLHLVGKAEHLTSPIRVEGSTLVLYFEQSTEKDAQPLTLRYFSGGMPAPMVEVIGGGLEIIGGRLLVPDADTVKVTYMAKVTGGDVLLLRTKFEGPQQKTARDFSGVLHITGSGKADTDKAWKCVLSDCVLVANERTLTLNDIGLRTAVKQSVLVSGQDAIAILPGANCKTKANMQLEMEEVTLAGRRSLVYLGDAPQADPFVEPVVVSAQNCLYANPFVVKFARAKTGLLLHERDALSRGVLVWYGKREAFDTRLHFPLWSLDGKLPERSLGFLPWRQTWGSALCRDPRSDSGSAVFSANAWALTRLKPGLVDDPPGANLDRLGIRQKK